MRRSVSLILLLALLSAGVLAGSTLALYGKGEAVTVTAHTLAGDPSAAEGLTVNLPLVLEDCLFWDISFPADHPEQAVTIFNEGMQDGKILGAQGTGHTENSFPIVYFDYNTYLPG